ncbi:unnamed protein product [Rhizoctonia solani]|uniref:BTB domain-containing protein n=1 Tax=Rhizoctonia solani TaxID=456999 RepID=A0A8H3DVD0_9AGAM|nr:unnamed protein product [Rhizoctonia solani]
MATVGMEWAFRSAAKSGVTCLLPALATHVATSFGLLHTCPSANYHKMAESSNEASSWQSVEQTECAPEAGFAHGFGPSNGGEFIIHSKDNVEFHVHATVLSVASPIFKDLMSVGSGERVVELTEDAQTIRLMLTYLYHQATPQISTFDLAVKGFEIARKYEIDAMTEWLKTLFRLETSSLYIRHHPLEVYDVASLYGFKDIAEACYDHCIRKLDLEDEEEMDRYTASRLDPKSALSLVSRLVRRRAIITETLFTSHLYPMNLLASQWDRTHLADRSLADKLICEKCRPPYSDIFYSSVSWQTFWAHQAREVLFREPLVDCERVFKIGFLCKPYDHDGTETFCEQCFELLHLRNHVAWEDWASMVRSYFGEKLGEKVFAD